MNRVEAALAWYDAGFCVLYPAEDGTKAPLGGRQWGLYQAERPSREKTEQWADTHDGIGLVMGAVSGQAVMFELEKAAVDADMHLALRAGLEEAAPGLWEKLNTYVELSGSGGLHWIFRVDTGIPVRTVRLARRPNTDPDDEKDVDVLIETKAEGGFAICAPSGGKVHKDGGQWVTIAGTPGVVGVLTPDELETLYAVARTFDQMPEVVSADHRDARPVINGDLTPGQDYAHQHTWTDLLEPLGWTFHHSEGEKDLWTRPGKHRREGASATVNYDGNDNVWIFSSAVQGYPIDESLTKFAFYAWTHHGGDYSAAARDLRGKGYGSQTPRDTSAAQADQRAMMDLLPDGSVVAGGSGDAGEEGSSRSSFDLTDHGNAKLLALVESPRLRYSPSLKAWLRWDGDRWEIAQSDSVAVQAMRALVEAMADDDKALYTHKIKSMGKSQIERAVWLCSRDPLIEVDIARFDADPYQLNTPDGVVDLLNGEVSAHTPDGLHTKMTAVGFDPSLAAPRWQKFLADTFADSPELIPFLQRLAGYSATGKVTHHVLPFLQGTGANGKSVFTDVMLKVLGTYAAPATADFLLHGGKDESSAVAELRGLRFVLCNEVGPDAKFHEQKIKMLTGGDQLAARRLYENQVTWTPTHHLWLVGNHQPTVQAGGDSFFRRLRLVRFTRTVPEAEQIEGLADQLVREEGPAILAWIVEGARRQHAGLDEPESVMAATAGYAEEEDVLGRFVEERVRFGGGEHVRLATADVRHAYEQWCFAEGEKPIAANVFGRELKARGAGLAKSGSRRFYTNVTLVRPEDAPEMDRPEQLIYGIGD